MKFNKNFFTNYYDLDWNRHVTSRAYEKMVYSSRMDILKEFGFSISDLLHKKYKWINKKSLVKFHSQQYQDAELKVETEIYKSNEISYHFHHKIFDKDEKLVCLIGNESILVDGNGNRISFSNLDTGKDLTKIFNFELENLRNTKTLNHDIYIPFSDMSCFWNLQADSIWKIFEEGRFLFFHELVDLDLITKTDTTTFFMGGEILIHELPKPGTKIILKSWIEKMEKIRFYFRQDILSEDGKLLVQMQDEQLFVSLSKSRPKKVPLEFLGAVGEFVKR